MSFIIANSRVQNFKISSRVEKKINEKIYYFYHKKELNIANLEKIKPKLLFFVHWSSLIPEEIFNKYVCIIFHMTDLPFGRGGSPLQNLIVRGFLRIARKFDGIHPATNWAAQNRAALPGR